MAVAGYDVVEGVVVLYHLLVVGPALLGSPACDCEGHVQENLLGFSAEFVPELIPVFAQELDVHALLLRGPPPPRQPGILLGIPRIIILRRKVVFAKGLRTAEKSCSGEGQNLLAPICCPFRVLQLHCP